MDSGRRSELVALAHEHPLRLSALAALTRELADSLTSPSTRTEYGAHQGLISACAILVRVPVAQLSQPQPGTTSATTTTTGSPQGSPSSKPGPIASSVLPPPPSHSPDAHAASPSPAPPPTAAAATPPPPSSSSSSRPPPPTLSPLILSCATQALRALGNLAFDHDANRLEALRCNVPLSTVSLLVALRSSLPHTRPLVVIGAAAAAAADSNSVDADADPSDDYATCTKAAVGALLNLTLRCKPVQAQLCASQVALRTLVSLIDPSLSRSSSSPSSMTPPPPPSSSAAAGGGPSTYTAIGQWARPTRAESAMSDREKSTYRDAVVRGNKTAAWVASLLDELVSFDKKCLPADALAPLVSAILAPFASAPPAGQLAHSVLRADVPDLLAGDMDTLTSLAGSLEHVVSESDALRNCLAGLAAPPATTKGTTASMDGEVDLALLFRMLDFVQYAHTPEYFLEAAQLTTDDDDDEQEEEDDDDDKVDVHKAVSSAKASVMRALIDVPNSDAVMRSFVRHLASKDAVAGSPHDALVSRLVSLLGVDDSSDRDDLQICAAHFLAALARCDEMSLALMSSRYGLAAALVRVLEHHVPRALARTTESGHQAVQVIFGALGLARHLAIPAINKSLLGELGLVKLAAQCLDTRLDAVAPVQTAAVGLLKQLCAHNVHNSLRAAAEDDTLAQIVQAIRRSDDVRLRSEATRIIVNVVRALFATRIPHFAPLTASSPSASIGGGGGGPAAAGSLRVATTTSSGALLANAGNAVGPTSTISPIAPSHSLARGAGAGLNTPGGGGAEPRSAQAQAHAASLALDDIEVARSRARPNLITVPVVEALCEMLRRSERYAILVNEAVVALTLIAGSGAQGARNVLDALLGSASRDERGASQRAQEAAQAAQKELMAAAAQGAMTTTTPAAAATTAANAPAPAPSNASDMLVKWLSLAALDQLSTSSAGLSTGAAAVRPEMIANACALLVTVLVGGEVARCDAAKLDELRAKARGPLKGIVANLDDPPASQHQHQRGGGGGAHNVSAYERTARRALEAVAVPPPSPPAKDKDDADDDDVAVKVQAKESPLP